MDALNLINEHKNKLLNIALIVLALVISNNIYKSQSKAIGVLKEKKENEIEKGAVLDNISKVDKKLDPYRRLFKGKKDKFLVVQSITNIAKDFDVKVEGIRPQGEQKYSAYIKYPFEVIFCANDYHDIGQIIARIENDNNEVYIIEDTLITPGQTQGDGAWRLNVRLRGASILFQD